MPIQSKFNVVSQVILKLLLQDNRMLRAPSDSTSGPAMATCPFVSITANLDNRPYLHVYLLLVSLYMEGGGYYHISLYGFGRTVRASISIQANIAICGRGTGRLPSQCFRTVLNSVATVPTPFASSRLLVTMISQ